MQNEQNIKKQEILTNLQLLLQALKDKSISVSDYASLYLSYHKQLKNINKGA
jgi:hypothetical protein